jgi:hypothetical protein
MSESTHRWVVEETDGGVRICKGHHEKHEDCEWVYYIEKPNESAVQESGRPLAIQQLLNAPWKYQWWRRKTTRRRVEVRPFKNNARGRWENVLIRPEGNKSWKPMHRNTFVTLHNPIIESDTEGVTKIEQSLGLDK